MLGLAGEALSQLTPLLRGMWLGCRSGVEPRRARAQQSGLSATKRRAGFTAALNSRRPLAPISRG